MTNKIDKLAALVDSKKIFSREMAEAISECFLAFETLALADVRTSARVLADGFDNVSYGGSFVAAVAAAHNTTE